MAIAQFVNGLITKLRLNELVDGINANSTELDKVILLSTDITKTVGTGGDFTTLNEAINWCKKVVPNGHKVDLNLLSGFVMAEQILLENVNLGFVTINSIDSEVTILSDNITIFFITGKTIFGGINSTMPNINVYFVSDNYGSTNIIHGLAVEGFGSNAKINSNKGFKDMNGYGMFAYKGANILADQCVIRNSGYGIKASEQSNISAINSTFDSCVVYAYGNSNIDVSSSTITNLSPIISNITSENSRINGTYVNHYGTTTYYNRVSDGGIITSNNATSGKLSQTANTITANGIIFQ